MSRMAWGPPRLWLSGASGSLSGRLSGQGMKLASHHCLVLKLKLNWTILVFPFFTFMVCIGTTLLFSTTKAVSTYFSTFLYPWQQIIRNKMYYTFRFLFNTGKIYSIRIFSLNPCIITAERLTVYSDSY